MRRWLSLVTDAPPQHYRGVEPQGEPLFVEIFHWASGDAARRAHEPPEVRAIWGGHGEADRVA